MDIFVCAINHCVSSQKYPNTQTEYHQCIIITLDRELQVHKHDQCTYCLHHKNHNNHIEHNSSSPTVVLHKIFTISSSEESFSDWLKISGISRKTKHEYHKNNKISVD